MKGVTCFRTEPEKELSINYVPRKYLSSNLRLINITDQPLAFKIKTNVPIYYLVKPHIGILPPYCSIDIAITMQPTDYTPQNTAINDKFLINVISLAQDTDISSLSEPSRFQKIWDLAPKNQIQASKLQVVLKFDSSSTPSNLSDKNEEESLRESGELKEQAKEDRPSQLDDASIQEAQSRETFKGTSMMLSFGNEISGATIERSLNQGQGNINEPAASGNLSSPRGRIKSDAKEKKKEGLFLDEEKNGEAREVLKLLEEKARMLEKRIEELNNENKILNMRYQEISGKSEDQTKMLFDFSAENTKLKSELENLKSSTFREKYFNKEGSESAAFQLWHILLAAILSMLIGAVLSTN